MSQYQRIFLIADPAMRRSPALARATALCRLTGATLHLGLFLKESLLGDVRPLFESRRRWLETEAARLRSEGLAVSAQVFCGKSVGQEIRACVEELQPDLVIKDAEHAGHLRRMLLKSLDWRLLRDCPAPLMLINPASHADPKRILVAVDLAHGPVLSGDLHDQTIKAALALAIQCQGELHLAYDLGLPEPGRDADADDGDAAAESTWQFRDAIRRRFAATAAAYGVPAECQHLLTGRGDPAETLCEFVTAQHFDVLVVGAVQRGALDRLLMGSTAEAIAERRSCDLLAVRADTAQRKLAQLTPAARNGRAGAGI